MSVSLCVPFVNAQLSERYDNPSSFITGTRPVQGNFGLTIGPSFVELEDFFDKDINARGLPLIKFKYYTTDNFEVRLGFQHYKTNQTMEGNLLLNEAGYSIDNRFKSFNRISIGGAYHFSPKNLLDVYVGAALPIGSDKYEVTSRWEHASNFILNDFFEEIITKNTRVYGYNLFIGLQAFIADLPIAIGFEYGLTGWMNSGLQYEVERLERVDGNTTTMNYFTNEKPRITSTKYDNLQYDRYESGTDLRITFSYYFIR